MVRRTWMGVGAAIALAGLALAGPARAAEPAADGVQIGMVQGMFRDIQPAMVQALSRPLRDMIRKQTGFTGDVEIVPDAFALADRMKAKRLHLGVFHGFEFAWVREQNPNIVPLAVSVPSGRKLQACVVVHEDSPAKALADLKGGVVLVHRGTKAHCLAFLDRERVGLSADAAVPKADPTLTAERALDAVVNGDAPAALVDASALTGYEVLQPGAAKHLRVLARSEVFPLTVITYNKGLLPEATAGRIRRLLLGAHATAAGKPLMMLWNLRGFEDVPDDYDAQLERIAKSYPAPTRPTAVRVKADGGKAREDR
ncbi:MAG TPA: PhnD/SsuA/transferrin family substrate-binding protein [Fimbriiglobus sp.]|nr:PhnD/SsuA/transferrin family substrate-binding protein [Fimbriiglobus sp.]